MTFQAIALLPSLLPDTAEPVLTWARSFPADQILGYTFDIYIDPFAAYLTAMGEKRPAVGWRWHWVGNVRLGPSHDYCRPTPEWIRQVLQIFDADHTRKPVTAATLITIIERVVQV